MRRWGRLGIQIIFNLQKNQLTRGGVPSHFLMLSVKSVEITVAAYPFGHSKIRDRYQFNSFFPTTNFSTLSVSPKALCPHLGILIGPQLLLLQRPTRVKQSALNDTRVALSMGQLLIAPGAPPNSLFTILSDRKLALSLALRAPPAQYVAKRMKLTRLITE
ncbi:hypothetical protein ACFFSP_03630 [Persicitalea jodogahamensis]|uniref:hypothetical protein n=1 Tax=Persicitalea jodogahamensis TaxID=402147 RepID=UPI001677431B|nr:hypothetical protein [Persicitalea jodogahamensis]